jgi:hypothetical protein
MADKSYEKHVEDLIKMRSEIRSALNAYKLGNTGEEVYFMVRAKAVADALGISDDEFLDHKMLVEKEEGMVDCLMMPLECISSLNEYYKRESKPKGEEVYTVIFADIYDNNWTEKVFNEYDSAYGYYTEKVRHYFMLDKRNTDSFGNKFEECLTVGQAFFEDNGNHGDIYVWMAKRTIE